MAPNKSTDGTQKSSARKSSASKKPSKAPGKTGAQTKRKTGTGKRNKGPGIFHELKKTVLAVTILVAVCLTTAMLVDIIFKTGRPMAPAARGDGKKPPVTQPRVPAPVPPSIPLPLKPEPLETKEPSTGEPKNLTKAEGLKEKELAPDKGNAVNTPEKKKDPSIVYEVYDDVTQVPSKNAVPPKKEDFVPRIAIIIDDIGYDKDLAMGLFKIDKNITFSILPFSPAGKRLAQGLSAKGAELMLHLPMEPTQYPRVNPGPGALLSSMSRDELLAQLHKDIHAVPGTVGVNNHMGSRLTSESDKMNQIFTVLKKSNLFFIDSRTSPDSKGEQSARKLQLKFSHRDVFLDNVQDVEYISGQIEKLIKQAKTHGSAIGIGHPHKATLEALRRELPKIRGEIRVVPASRLVEVPQG